MTITEVVEMLEYTINKRIDEFEKLRKAYASILRKKRLRKEEHECIHNLLIEQAKIAKDFQPVKDMMLQSNPQYKVIFEELISFYDENLSDQDISQNSVSQVDNTHTKQ